MFQQQQLWPQFFLIPHKVSSAQYHLKGLSNCHRGVSPIKGVVQQKGMSILLKVPLPH